MKNIEITNDMLKSAMYFILTRERFKKKPYKFGAQDQTQDLVTLTLVANGLVIISENGEILTTPKSYAFINA